MGEVLKTFFLHLAVLTTGVALCGCVTEDNPVTGGNEEPVKVEGAVRFECSIASSKAAFDGEDAGQILWQSGDRVKIFCEQARDAKEASYSVTPGSTAKDGFLTASGNALEWNADGGQHRFFAVYPESAAVMAKEGVLTVPVNLLQKCTVNSSDATGKDVVAVPDKSQVYLVATADGTPSEEGVSLVFKPLMTMLEITIPGPQSGGVSRVTGLSIATEITSKSAAAGDKFYYDIAASELVDLSRSSYGAPLTRSQTVFIDLVDESGNLTYVDVGSGRTLTVTAFLPPVSQNAAASIKSRTTVRVHMASDTEVVHPLKTHNDGGMDWTTRIPASTLYPVCLPSPVSGAGSLGNNWITYLPDDIPVCQLSLPGTHDAATVNCLTPGKCQVYTIAEQLKRGVRVFDLRPAMDNESTLGNIYHGILDTGVTMSSVFSDFDNYLIANPGEFVIVLMRYESDRNSIDVSFYNKAIRSFLTGNSAYRSRKAAFRPDLRVGDLRGKILIISRNDLTPDSSIETAYTGWSSGNVAGDVRKIVGTGGTTDIYVQDMYSQSCDGNSSDADFLAKKRQIVCGMMDIASRISTDAAFSNNWLVNYTSAYVGTGIFGIRQDSYARNAASTNTAAYNYLISREASPTGIVMMDFAGASVYNVGGTDFKVCGDLLVQKIIDNNYRW